MTYVDQTVATELAAQEFADQKEPVTAVQIAVKAAQLGILPSKILSALMKLKTERRSPAK